MSELSHDEVGEIFVESMDPRWAEFLRRVTTCLGLHRDCPFKVCRRAKACATRHVLCYQANEEDLKPIVQGIRARIWARAVARGAEIDVAPASEGDMRRHLAWEEREIAKIEAGEYGADDEQLTAHQLWLKRLARDEPRRPEAVAAAEGDLWPTLTPPSRTDAPSSSAASLPAEEPSMETPAGSANPESAASPGRRRRPDGIAARPRR